MPLDLFNNRLSLRALRLLALAKGFLRYRNPYRRAVWKHRVEFYERAWREAAEQLGCSWKPLGSGIFEVGLDGIRTLVSDNYSAIDDPVTMDLLSDKAVTYRILQEQAISIPRHAEFSLKSTSKAIAFLDRIQAENPGRNCVVKPVRGTGGGRGITAGVRSRSHLARAAAAGAIYCDDLLIEEQVAGDNYRLLYLDGQLIDAFVRWPPSVVGDGRRSLAALVKEANAERLRHKAAMSQVLLTVDLDMKRTLSGQGHSLRSVPAAGATVVLKTVVNENCGDDNMTATGMLCRSIVEEGARAVQALGIHLGGVDVITRDPAVPLGESGGVMLEVNAPPNFYYHYHKRDGCFPVALHVLRRLLGSKPEAPRPTRSPLEASFRGA